MTFTGFDLEYAVKQIQTGDTNTVLRLVKVQWPLNKDWLLSSITFYPMERLNLIHLGVSDGKTDSGSTKRLQGKAIEATYFGTFDGDRTAKGKNEKSKLMEESEVVVLQDQPCRLSLKNCKQQFSQNQQQRSRKAQSCLFPRM